jgi:two-component system response regulator AtoC
MKVLVVDDEKNIRESIRRLLELEGIESALAVDGRAGSGLLSEESFDAVKALKTGADDYLLKPFDPTELVLRLKSVVDRRRLEDRLEAGARTAAAGTGLVGESAAEPFVAVNIGAMQDTLVESELFGHGKGAFTGVDARTPGLVELGERGTLFLDEIGEMPLALQVKLLRVLQERKVRRLGGVRDNPIGARFISATNRDIEALVQREDGPAANLDLGRRTVLTKVKRYGL